MKVLGLFCSPRKEGNTETLIEEDLAGLLAKVDRQRSFL